ncbi:hypothetical protein DMR_10470 [Solidesulfovibrio magneticus RS-1]|uniref:Uncharacterized protein n=1 Tax=Solidesulfovibrio magneticus (strain ATCC 700980 / DSM 13731 / RS-1) TaxID=573370 RepID=C4XKZ9_SOLM1|nr:hypothetical protein DMR_10470 [Solidesulfovibrio magneticus RS-1]
MNDEMKQRFFNSIKNSILCSKREQSSFSSTLFIKLYQKFFSHNLIRLNNIQILPTTLIQVI